MRRSPRYGLVGLHCRRSSARPTGDQLGVVGAALTSIKVVLPGLSELHALGLLDVTRYPKRHVCAISERWRDIRTMRDAKIFSVVARVQRTPPVMQPQPATASTA